MTPLLTDSQVKILADIGISVGQLAAASMVLPFIIPGLDNTKLPMLLLGLVITFGSWLFSVVVVRRIEI